MYHILDTGKNQYKLRLGAADAVAVERSLGKSLLALFGGGSINELPDTEQIAIVLHGSLQKFHHGVSNEKTLEIIDEYLENGGSFIELFEEVVEVLKVSGFFKAPDEEESKKAKENKKADKEKK